MSTVRIYHNPRCSKSRETLALLRERGVEPEVIEYLKTPPSPAELETLLERLGFEPRALMRRREREYTALGLDDEQLDRDALIRAMNEHPRLIERPIVVANGRAALGRPPKNALSVLD